MTGSDNHRFVKENWLNNLKAFYDEMMSLVDKRKVLEVVYLNLSKVFMTISHNIRTYELMKNTLDKCTLID